MRGEGQSHGNPLVANGGFLAPAALLGCLDRSTSSERLRRNRPEPQAWGTAGCKRYAPPTEVEGGSSLHRSISPFVADSHMDPDPQELLPEELRHRWAVVPRDTRYQMLLVGTLLGAGTALSVAGLIVGSNPMKFGFPIALVLAQLQNWVFPWERRAVSALRRFVSRNDASA